MRVIFTEYGLELFLLVITLASLASLAFMGVK